MPASDHNQRLVRLFEAALELAAEQRAAFLDAACSEDADLRRELDTLLAAHDAAHTDELRPALLREIADDALLGQHVGPYAVLERLGEGGMGVVYLAERRDVGKQVALKLVRYGPLASPAWIQRFMLERRVLARLEHPNIARLLDAGVTEQGLPYFVMEYVDGQPIDAYCDANHLTVDERLALFEEACRAVHYAHRNLVVHRDLKPSHILVTQDRQVRLLDFGIAKLLAVHEAPEQALTQTDQTLLTPEYASPEQVRGEAVSTASDVYALGVILFELLTGHRPYQFASRMPTEVARVVCQVEPERPSTVVRKMRDERRAGPSPETDAPATIPQVRRTTLERLRRRLGGDLDLIVMKALRKEPERRYQTVGELLDDLQRHQQGLPLKARKDTLAYRTGRFVRRHAAGVAAAAGVVVLIIGFGLFYMVQVTQERDRARLEATKATQVSEFLVELFEVSDPSESLGDTLSAREVMDRGAARLFDELRDQPEVQAMLMDVVGRVYQNLGLYDRARPLLRDALDTRRHLSTAQPQDVAQSLNHLGLLLQDEGDYEAAEAHYREAITLHGQHRGSSAVDLATSQKNLASVLHRKGDYEAAEALYREALAMQRTLFGEVHEEVASTLNDLAVLIKDRGRYDEAEPLYREALDQRRTLHGEPHPRVAVSLSNLALFLEARGRYDDAEGYLREAVTMQRALYGDEHPNLATSLNNLALLLHRKGAYDDAEPLYQEALAMRRTLLGDAHPHVATTLSNLAVLYQYQGAYDKAEPLMREALALGRQRLGPEHPSVATSLNNLALVLQSKGSYEEAEALYREALVIRRQRLGEEHPLLALSQNNLGMLLHTKGDIGGAEPLLREALALRRTLLGPEHPELAITLSALAAVLQDRKAYAEAESLYQEALAMQRTLLGDAHPRTARSLAGLGSLLLATDRPQDAEPLLRQGVATLRQAVPDHDLTLLAQNTLGACLTALRQYAEAEPLLAESYPALKARYGPTHRYTAEALSRLIHLYDAWGRPEHAASYRALLPQAIPSTSSSS